VNAPLIGAVLKGVAAASSYEYAYEYYQPTSSVRSVNGAGRAGRRSATRRRRMQTGQR
jgi:hypothetical protein